jgi:hypothetical protein
MFDIRNGAIFKKRINKMNALAESGESGWERRG